MVTIDQSDEQKEQNTRDAVQKNEMLALKDSEEKRNHKNFKKKRRKRRKNKLSTRRHKKVRRGIKIMKYLYKKVIL